jgi:hypothetical protein
MKTFAVEVRSDNLSEAQASERRSVLRPPTVFSFLWDADGYRLERRILRLSRKSRMETEAIETLKPVFFSVRSLRSESEKGRHRRSSSQLRSHLFGRDVRSFGFVSATPRVSRGHDCSRGLNAKGTPTNTESEDAPRSEASETKYRGEYDPISAFDGWRIPSVAILVADKTGLQKGNSETLEQQPMDGQCLGHLEKAGAISVTASSLSAEGGHSSPPRHATPDLGSKDRRAVGESARERVKKGLLRLTIAKKQRCTDDGQCRRRRSEETSLYTVGETENYQVFSGESGRISFSSFIEDQSCFLSGNPTATDRRRRRRPCNFPALSCAPLGDVRGGGLPDFTLSGSSSSSTIQRRAQRAIQYVIFGRRPAGGKQTLCIP